MMHMPFALDAKDDTIERVCTTSWDEMTSKYVGDSV